MATKREEYIAKLKTQLDQWNAEMAKWESQAAEAQASMRAEYEKQLAAIAGIRTRPGNSCARYRRPRARPGWSSLAARTSLGGDAQGLRERQRAIQEEIALRRGRLQYLRAGAARQP